MSQYERKHKQSEGEMSTSSRSCAPRHFKRRELLNEMWSLKFKCNSLSVTEQSSSGSPTLPTPVAASVRSVSFGCLLLSPDGPWTSARAGRNQPAGGFLLFPVPLSSVFVP